MNNRVQYLDTLKAIAIFLVVFCHFVLLSETVTDNLFMSACWLAVPVFFIVNGALLFARPLNIKKHIRKTAGIYAVLVVWKLIYMLLIPPVTGSGPVSQSAGDVINYLFLFGELPGIVNGHLWFIEALLSVYVVFPLFRIVWDRKEDGTGRRLTAGFALLSLACTNGLYSLEVLGQMLRSAGISFPFSFTALADFQPFGKYGNMLGFFLLGALLYDRKGPVFRKAWKEKTAGGIMLTAGLLALWGVKWFLSGRKEWDGILLTEGYRHIPVIFMAAGLFLLCRNVEIKTVWLSACIRGLASRTLGIFYIHWIFGWLLVNPLAGFLVNRGIGFGTGANVIKNLVLIIPAFLVTLVLERIPVVKKLVAG